MNPIKLLTQTIDTLWIWTYSIVAGWGITFTLLVAAVIWLLARQIRLEHKLYQLENRVVTNERELNLTLNKWQK
jgi:uncharacterized protein (DUF58 family)